MIRPEMLCPSWSQKPLGEVVEFLDHLRRPITAIDRVSGPYPYYGANGQQDSVADYIFDEPLILMAEDGGYFGDPDRTIAYRVDGKCWVNNHAHVLRPKDGVDIGFLCRQLEKYDVTRFINGATRQKLNKSSASEIPITLPPLVEQKRIAAILDKADAIRRKRRQAIQLADEFLRSVFLDMFGDPVLNPKGWPEKKLNQVSEIVSGVTKGRNLIGKRTIFVPYMRVANVQDGHINIDDVQKIEVLDNEVEKYRLKEGDILLTEGGDPDKLGRGAVWRGEIDPCIHQNHIFRVRTDNKKIIPEYLSTLIGSARGKRYFLKAAKQTTGVASINKTQLSNFPIIVPPLTIQNEYFKMVNRINTLTDKEKVKNKHLEKLFSSLLQSAFCGDL